MRLLKWLVGVLLGLHLLLALLLLGPYPALFRGAALVLSRTSAAPSGMRLAVYPHPEPSGKGWRHFTPGPLRGWIARTRHSMHTSF